MVSDERRKDCSCSQKDEFEPSSMLLQKHEMDTYCSWSILFLSMNLPYTWGGLANLEEYYKTLKEIDKNLQEVKQNYHISGIIAGMDAQVEVKPHQGPFVGSGTRMSHGSTARLHELESKF